MPRVVCSGSTIVGMPIELDSAISLYNRLHQTDTREVERNHLLYTLNRYAAVVDLTPFEPHPMLVASMWSETLILVEDTSRNASPMSLHAISEMTHKVSGLFKALKTPVPPAAVYTRVTKSSV